MSSVISQALFHVLRNQCVHLVRASCVRHHFGDRRRLSISLKMESAQSSPSQSMETVSGAREIRLTPKKNATCHVNMSFCDVIHCIETHWIKKNVFWYFGNYLTIKMKYLPSVSVESELLVRETKFKLLDNFDRPWTGGQGDWGVWAGQSAGLCHYIWNISPHSALCPPN